MVDFTGTQTITVGDTVIFRDDFYNRALMQGKVDRVEEVAYVIPTKVMEGIPLPDMRLYKVKSQNIFKVTVSAA